MEIDWELVNKIVPAVGLIVGAVTAVFNFMAAKAAKNAAVASVESVELARQSLNVNSELALLPYRDKYLEAFQELYNRLQPHISKLNGLVERDVYGSGGPVDIIDRFSRRLEGCEYPRHVMYRLVTESIIKNVDRHTKFRIRHEVLSEAADQLEKNVAKFDAEKYCIVSWKLLNKISEEIDKEVDAVTVILAELEKFKVCSVNRTGYDSVESAVNDSISLSNATIFWSRMAKSALKCVPGTNPSMALICILESLACYALIRDLWQ